jgi:hypothetical protein
VEEEDENYVFSGLMKMEEESSLLLGLMKMEEDEEEKELLSSRGCWQGRRECRVISSVGRW